ncbi:MAG: single-stranded DNA-binding protein [Lysobacterales bacterium]|jgi:single-strand DNA-binding protein
MNNWNIAGRVGRDAELRRTSGDTAVLNFPVAVDQRKNGEKQTLWVDVAVWGKRGEALAEYITKGTVVALSGEAGAKAGNDGKIYMKLDVGMGGSVTLLGGGQQQDKPGRQEPRQSTRPREQQRAAPPADSFDEDSIPF